MISQEIQHLSRSSRSSVRIAGRKIAGLTVGIVVSAALATSVAFAQQAPQVPQQRALKDMSLKEACPEVPREAGPSGTAMEPAQRAVTQMQKCIERLMIALNDKTDKEAFDNDLRTVIDAAQASVNLLKGQGGLMETASIYLNRLKTQRDEVPRRFTKDKQEERLRELGGLIKQAEDALAKLDKAAKDFNETIIYLNSQRPEIAYNLSVDDAREKVGALNRAVDIINNASKMLNSIGNTLSVQKPGF